MTSKAKAYTAAQALARMQDWCAYQERCQQEVRDKLYEYRLGAHEAENIISRLIADNFVNEERFAKAYAGGKFRIKKWGRLKIKAGLKAKRISDYCIKSALQEIDEADYCKTLAQLLDSKVRTLGESNPVRRKFKLLSYAAAKGYEKDLIMQVLNEDM